VPSPDGFLTSYAKDGRFVSYYGDNHPRFAGNVVKAMASARIGFRDVVALFADELARLDPSRQGERECGWAALVTKLDDELTARVEDVVRLTRRSWRSSSGHRRPPGISGLDSSTGSRTSRAARARSAATGAVCRS
jgi:hypothetical protein